jgi:hypothetical protein
MDLKPRPNHRLYLQILRRMTPEERLMKAFELSEFSRELFFHGLKRRFPNRSDEEIREIYLERLKKCHNWNY